REKRRAPAGLIGRFASRGLLSFWLLFLCRAKKKRLAVAAKRRAKALLCVVSLAVHRQDQDMFRQLLRSPGESLFLYLCKEKVTKKKAQPGPRSGQLRWPVPCASRASGGRP